MTTTECIQIIRECRELLKMNKTMHLYGSEDIERIGRCIMNTISKLNH